MPKQYEKRDAAFMRWFGEPRSMPGLLSWERDLVNKALRDAFNAGWAARKEAQYIGHTGEPDTPAHRIASIRAARGV